jgi:NADPH:quinone reductase-like Zn-dependent oxidoreductase
MKPCARPLAETASKHVLEMVGGDNLRRSVNALAADGRISLIGRLVDTEFTAPIVPIMRKQPCDTGHFNRLPPCF